MELDLLDAWWRAANYLSVGQIYLRDNPLLRKPLRPEHVKKRLLGHWGTTPGLNFIYAHLNRLIRQHDLNMLFITGPGHGGPGIVANTYLEGTYSETYPEVGQDEAGMRRLFLQFSYPGGIPSHVAAEIPGSIHEGGELGYSLAHAFGAAFDNPDLIVACVVGDGEAETGPLACSWHSNKFLHPQKDGVVLPILHLNGYKIANPTILSRIPEKELLQLLRGYGYHPHLVQGHDPQAMHVQMAHALEACLDGIQQARSAGSRPEWPMLVLRSPKGWTGPPEVDGEKTEGSWRSHQVPFKDARGQHLGLLEGWLRSYRPHELFDERGTLRPYLRALVPQRRMSANPHANGGLLLQPLELPAIDRHAVTVEQPGQTEAEATAVLGDWLCELLAVNRERRNFRLFGPDETASNRLQAVFRETGRTWLAERLPEDDEGGHLDSQGRVMEVLSEHLCQGWLEGYLLTGRHGLFSCYEAFIHIVDSMFNQHAKWLKTAGDLPWRRPIASLNYLLTSHVWRQDHNGFSHQDPGFIDHVVNKKADVVRVYLPPDANTLLCTMEHCLGSRNYVNVVVAGKQPAPQFLTLAQAQAHCRVGLGRWAWASTDHQAPPEAVLACAGDVPTLEALAAAQLLARRFPDLRMRLVNVVDLMTLQPPSLHPHGLADGDFDALFTVDRPIVFAYHGYPWLIHRLTYRRTNHRNLHVHGYQEEGTTTTPFDMVVRNGLDRYSLARQVVGAVARLEPQRPAFNQWIDKKHKEHERYIREHGEDLPEIRHWKWGQEVARYR